MNQEVLAVIAGEKITQADFDRYLQGVPREQQAYASNPQFKEQFLEQLVSLYLFAQKGEDDKLAESEEFQAVMANARREILAQFAMREVLKTVEVSEEEIKAFYDENQAQFKKGETVSAKHILVETEEKCNEILATITSGEKTFEDAAKEFSTCPSGQRGGDLGAFGRGQMVPEFEQAAFEAEVDKVVGPVKTDFGYHLILVYAHSEASVATFDEVRDQIKAQLSQQKSQEAFQAKTAELKAKYLEI